MSTTAEFLTVVPPPSPLGVGRSVYGLRVHGLDMVDELDLCRPGASSEVTVQVLQDNGPRPHLSPMDGESGVRVLADGHHLELVRHTGRARLVGPALDSGLLAHPYLGPVAVAFNRWLGREAFHAGAFVAGGRAFVVIGRRTAGKSTLMATLAARGIQVLADDIVITNGREVFAGPRCIDLREPIPGLDLNTRLSRQDTRWRVALPAVPYRVPLGGWVFSGWADTVGMTSVPASGVLHRLAAWRALPELPTDPFCMLDLCAFPAWDFTRPRDWLHLGRSVDRLLDAVSSSRLRDGAQLGSAVDPMLDAADPGR